MTTAALQVDDFHDTLLVEKVMASSYVLLESEITASGLAERRTGCSRPIFRGGLSATVAHAGSCAVFLNPSEAEAFFSDGIEKRGDARLGPRPHHFGGDIRVYYPRERGGHPSSPLENDCGL